MAAPESDTRVPADEPIIAFTRLLDAPRALVWQVWTDPAHIARWWGPTGFRITNHAMAVTPGGIWDFAMHGPDGRDYDNRITYHEVVPPARLVYSHGEPGDTEQFHVTVTFAEEGRGRTRLVMLARFPSLAARDHVVREVGAVEGGQQTLDRLADYLARHPF
ncbi:MAG TPA: SRPBCC family protein [Rhizomicrobium sp.]